MAAGTSSFRPLGRKNHAELMKSTLAATELRVAQGGRSDRANSVRTTERMVCGSVTASASGTGRAISHGPGRQLPARGFLNHQGPYSFHLTRRAPSCATEGGLRAHALRSAGPCALSVFITYPAGSHSDRWHVITCRLDSPRGKLRPDQHRPGPHAVRATRSESPTLRSSGSSRHLWCPARPANAQPRQQTRLPGSGFHCMNDGTPDHLQMRQQLRQEAPLQDNPEVTRQQESPTPGARISPAHRLNSARDPQSCQQPQPGKMPDPNTHTAAQQAAVAVLSCCTRCSNRSNFTSDQVELSGLEPLTSCMPSGGSTSTRVHHRRSPSRDVLHGPPPSAPVAVHLCCNASSWTQVGYGTSTATTVRSSTLAKSSGLHV